jgi:hypothetical protein
MTVDGKFETAESTQEDLTLRLGSSSVEFDFTVTLCRMSCGKGTTRVEFAVRGLGTPAPISPTRHLVISGLNRYVRNPMYIGVFLAILGQSIMFRSTRLTIYAMLFCICVELFVRWYEEPSLFQRFGEAYQTNCDGGSAGTRRSSVKPGVALTTVGLPCYRHMFASWRTSYSEWRHSWTVRCAGLRRLHYQRSLPCLPSNFAVSISCNTIPC